ncbi:unnamed protein product, partial [Amoebophrya sp. A25]
LKTSILAPPSPERTPMSMFSSTRGRQFNQVGTTRQQSRPSSKAISTSDSGHSSEDEEFSLRYQETGMVPGPVSRRNQYKRRDNYYVTRLRNSNSSRLSTEQPAR